MSTEITREVRPRLSEEEVQTYVQAGWDACVTQIETKINDLKSQNSEGITAASTEKGSGE